jgi:hypothetical protein
MGKKRIHIEGRISVNLNGTITSSQGQDLSKIWMSDSLPKVNTFCWVMVHGKLLTRENLQKRGLQGPTRCVLCREHGEINLPHLFRLQIFRYLQMFGNTFSRNFGLWLGDEGIVNGKTSTPSSIF